MRIRAVGRADVDADRRPVLVDGSVVAAFLFTTLSKLNKTSRLLLIRFFFLLFFRFALSHFLSVFFFGGVFNSRFYFFLL